MICQISRKLFIPYLRHQVFERLHDLGTFCFLVIREAASNDNHCCQHNTQVQLQTEEKVSQRTICLKGFQFVQINCLAFKCPMTSMKVLAVSVHFAHKGCPQVTVVNTTQRKFISLCGNTPKHIKLTHWISCAYEKSFWTECLKEVNLPWAQQAARPASEVNQTFLLTLSLLGSSSIKLCMP